MRGHLKGRIIKSKNNKLHTRKVHSLTRQKNSLIKVADKLKKK